MFLYYISVSIYLLLWVTLLIHCVKRRAFYPVFGTGWGTKALWLGTFLLFSPPLTVMYIIFGVVIKPKDYHKQLKPIRAVSVIILMLMAVIVFTIEMPAWGKGSKPKIFTKDTKEDGYEFKTAINAGKLEANNNISTTTSSCNSSFARFAGRTVLLKTSGNDELLARVGEKLAKSLAENLYIEKVEYFPDSTYKPVTKRVTDVMIEISMPSKTELNTPVGRKLDAVFAMETASEPHRGSYSSVDNYSPPVLEFTIKSTLNHKSTLKGYESRQARYKQQADDIAKQLEDAITKQFKDWIDKYGLMPELDDVFYGKHIPPPDFEYFKGKKNEIVFSGSGLMVNNHCIWFCEDPRPTIEVLREIQQQLKDAGWKITDYMPETKYSNPYIRHSKGPEEIYVFRMKQVNLETGREVNDKPGDNDTIPNMPIVFHYKNRFDNDQVDTIRKHLLSSDADVETLIMFSGLFNGKKNSNALAAELEKKKGLNFNANLYLAQHYQHRNETEKAKNALLFARALAYTVRDHSPRQSDIKQLAKKLGDEKLAEQPIGVEIFQQIGLIDANSLDQPYEIEKKLGEAVSFYYEKKDNTIKTVTFRVTNDESGNYSVEHIEKEKGMSSVGHGGGVGNTENWMTTDTFGGRDCTVNVEIRLTPHGTFKYKAQKI